jgi:DNA-binding transcriptional regulator YhcF (GntR family)
VHQEGSTVVDRADPRYVRIVAEIRRRIDNGDLRPGDRVPSTRQIIREWGVAMATATKVLTTLRQHGVVRTVRGVGTIVGTPEPQRPVRRREPVQELTRERIVRTAIEIADTERLAALSMRRIATELGVATMSLYRYVPGKDELILWMADAAFAEAVFPAPPPPGWRARLAVAARLQWATYRRHPWLAQVVSVTRPQAVPNLLAHAEWALRAVDGLGLDAASMLHVHITLFSHVRGTAVNLEPEAEAEQHTGMTGEQWMEVQSPAFAAIMASGDTPTFASVTTQPGLDFDSDLETLFEFGLQRLLDGFAVFFEGRISGAQH